MFCKACGSKIAANGKFCPACGAPVSAQAPAQIQTPTSAPPDSIKTDGPAFAPPDFGTPPQARPQQDFLKTGEPAFAPPDFSVPPQARPPQDFLKTDGPAFAPPDLGTPPQARPQQDFLKTGEPAFAPPDFSVPPQARPPQDFLKTDGSTAAPPDFGMPQARPAYGQERLDKAPPYTPPKEAPQKQKGGKGPLIALIAVLAVLIAAGAGLFIHQQTTGHWLWEADRDAQADRGKEEKTEKRKNGGEETADSQESDTLPLPDGTVSVMAGDPLPEDLDYDSVDYEAGETIEEKLWAPLPVLGNSALKRGDVTAVTFTNDLSKVPAAGAWDVSAAGDGSVKAWSDHGHLYIAASGRIRPNSCRDLFAGYINALSIDFGKAFDTAGVTDMSGMFDSCLALTSLDVSGFDTSSVTDMSWMFEWCVRLKSLDLSGWDTSRVTSMSCMFNYCPELASLDLTGFDTSSVEAMDSMFADCHSLMTLDLSGFNTAGVKDMSWMFYNCVSMPAFHIESFSDASLTDVRYMFGLDPDMFRKNADVTVYKNDGAFRPERIGSNEGWFEDGAAGSAVTV